MRHIKKPEERDAPHSFQRWKSRHPNAKYSRLKDGDIKRAIKVSLATRQKFLCCYCECRISRDTSHIEHIEPQMGGQSSKTTDYSNMAASCIREPKRGDYIEDAITGAALPQSTVHCGHARGSHTVVSPYDSRCEYLFEYSFSGKVFVNSKICDPMEIRLAQQSILYLNLNASSLVAMRKIAMFETVKMLKSGMDAESILREMSGRLPPFYSAAKSAIAYWES